METSLPNNPGTRHARCLRDEDMANGRDIDIDRPFIGKT